MKRQKKRLCALLCTILLLNTLVLAFAQSALAVSYRQGDSGSAVTTIQTKLKRWGYFDGPVDGIYGSKTSKAVRSFQRKNGLTADGVAGPATLKALGMEQTSQNSGSSQRQRGRGSAGEGHLSRGTRRALRRPGSRGRSYPKPHRPPLLPQHLGRCGLRTGCVHLYGGRPDRPAHRLLRLPGGTGRPERRRPVWWRDLLF